MNPDMQIPTGLSAKGRKAALIIKKFVEEIDSFTGGCRMFYTPAEWKSRGEYGLSSELIVVYDGGTLHSIMEGEYGWKLKDKLDSLLSAEGVYLENCTGWYAGVYLN